MKAYKHYYKCRDVNKILDSINDMLLPKGMYITCHGRNHAMFVVDKTEYILKSLAYDSRTVELGKIAALLHDIGNIAGRWNHAQKSAALATVLLEYPVHFLPDEKKLIIQAIEDHSKGNKIASAVGAALLIADKIDISKRRLISNKVINKQHKYHLDIKDVGIHVANKVITINITINEAVLKDLLIQEKRGFIIAMKAAVYLGCTCQFQINGRNENFF